MPTAPRTAPANTQSAFDGDIDRDAAPGVEVLKLVIVEAVEGLGVVEVLVCGDVLMVADEDVVFVGGLLMVDVDVVPVLEETVCP